MTDTTKTATPKTDPYRSMLEGFDVNNEARRQADIGKMMMLIGMIDPREGETILMTARYLCESAGYTGKGLLQRMIAAIDDSPIQEDDPLFSDEYIAGAGHMFTAILAGLALAEESLGRKHADGLSIKEALSDIRNGMSQHDAWKKQADKIPD